MMKRALIFLAITCMFASCERGFEELNTSPNAQSEVEPNHLFAQAQFKYHTDYFNGVLTEVWAINSWMQVQANINGIASLGDNYFISGDGLNNTWRLAYAEVLGNVNEAIRLTESDPEKVNELAIYRIYRAYVFHRITDLWGDVPYSAALNTINDENEPDYTPFYDSQSFIYKDLISELRSAASSLEPGQATIGSQDWIYQGDVMKWKRFSNSLCLRLATRMSASAPLLSESTITELVAEDTFISSNSESARFPHDASARNPFYELHNTSQGMYNPSQFLISTLQTDADPRLIRYAEYSPESVIFGTFSHVGIPSFMLSSEIDPAVWNEFKTSYIGEYFQDVNRDTDLLSYAELSFLLSEAALNGMSIGPTASEYLEDGIRAHMSQMDIAQTDVDSYISTHVDSNTDLEQIINEKWKTFVYADAVELYSEWRRTGFPVLIDDNGTPVNVTEVPVRMAYPAIEISFNSENVSAVGLGINDFNSSLWWDL